MIPDLDQQELQRKSEELKRHKINNIKQNIINSLSILQLPYELENIIFEYAFDDSKIETNNSLKEKIKNYYDTENEHLIQELDVSCITSMYKLFEACIEFNLCLDNWNTSNVIDMSYMFYFCVVLNQPIRFNTSNVTNMLCMFLCCNTFNQVIEFDTSNVVDMSYMFAGCKDFDQPIDFDTSKVTNMSYMFYDCHKFNQQIAFDTSNVIYMPFMFWYCSKFNKLIDFNTSNVIDMTDMFKDCKSLEEKNKQLIMR